MEIFDYLTWLIAAIQDIINYIVLTLGL
jgi:hypothetical protein